MTVRFDLANEAPDRKVDVSETKHLLAAPQRGERFTIHEVLVERLSLDECIGLVLETRDQYFHSALSGRFDG